MDEEIRQLNKEEYDQLKAAAERKRIRKSRIEINADKIVQGEMLVGEEGLEIGAKAWQMRKNGWSLPRIAKELSVPSSVLEECLKEFEARVSMEAGRLMQHFMTLDMERIEDQMAYWLPIATAGPINIQKIRDGEVFTEPDFDRPLKASYWVLHAIQTRLKMLLALTGRTGASEATNSTNILVWLQQVLPGVGKAVSESQQRADSLILETQAEERESP